MRPKPAMACLALAALVGGFCIQSIPATAEAPGTPPASTPAQTDNPFNLDEQQQFLRELTPDERATLVALRSRYVLADPECPLPTSEKQPFIVKFRETLSSELAQSFESAGARFLGYVKSHTYFMRAENAQALNQIRNLLASTPQVAGTVLRERVDACSEDMWKLVDSGTFTAGEYRLIFWRDVTHGQAIQLLNSHSAEITRATFDDRGELDLEFNYVDVLINKEDVLSVLDDHRVEWMQPTPKLVVHNQNAVALSNGLQSQVGASTSYGLTGDGVVVGVWDGGSVLDTHGDFQGAGANSPINNGSKRVRKMTGSTAYHPTHVTGTILGDGSGNSSARGFAPEAYALSYYFGGATQTERREARHDYRISASNHSYGAGSGYPRGGYDGTAQAEDQDNRDLLINQTRSAGNDGPYENSIQDDAGHKNAFIVGATYDSGSIASLSSIGPSDDGRLQPTVTANGYQLTSCSSSGSYGTSSGTSMSSPACCGALALITEHWFNKHNGRFFAPDTARGIVGITAQDNGPTGPDYVYGLGVIDVKAACDLINADVSSGGKNIVRGASRQGATIEYDMNVSGGTALKVSLSWLDLAASTSASVFLVNDLDLEVESPGGTKYYPYSGLTSGSSGNSSYQWTTTGPNRRDNIEVVEINSPQSGTWKVRVIGYDIPANAQGAPNLAQGFVLCSNRALTRDFVYVEDGVNGGSPVSVGSNMVRDFNVTHTGTVKGVRLYADIRHTARGDIDVIIEHPDGTQAHVETSDTNSKDDLIAVWPDTRQYDDDVTGLFNKPANGTWKVIIQDSGSLGSGTLEFLALEVDVEGGSSGGGGGTNNPPTANAGPDFNITEGVGGTLNGSGSDPDNDPLSYSWSQLSGPSISLSNPGSATPGFTAPGVSANTTATFRLTVSDGAASDTDDVTVTILDNTGGNNPPNAFAGNDAYAAHNTTVGLDGSGSSDPDGDPLTYAWTQTSGPSVSLSNASSATPSFTAPGTDAALTFELVVNDGNGASSNDFVTITINASGTAPSGGGSSGGGGGGSGGGGGCSSQPAGSTGVLVLLTLLGVIAFTQRRRA